jgi:mannose-6-phosphate isomerase
MSGDTGALGTMSAVPALSPMVNRIQGYDWGSTSALAQLQGRTPGGGPEAELWMGAHPAAPSDLVRDGDDRLPLPEALSRFPEAVLGADVLARFGPRLPFMLKILAIARPLSVQVHPDAARAHEIHRPGDSIYGDPFHKPEMLYALEPVEALYGFRTPGQAAMLLGRLECERLTGLIKALEGAGPAEGPEDDAERLHTALATLLDWPLSDRAALVAEIAAASGRLRATGTSEHPAAFDWLDRLVGLHPADPMVLAPLLLDLIHLSPGQTVYVPAGVPHCYLTGLGVEIMAASDNVLRCGLTSKSVDIDELLQVIDTRPCVPANIAGEQIGEHEVAWRPEIEDFQLTRIVVTPEAGAVTGDESITGPQILACTRGTVQVRCGGRTLDLHSGYSAFVTADAAPLTFSGDGDVFRAAVGPAA